MTRDDLIFEETHHQALEFLSVQALASGDIRTAFEMSDRRCRIKPIPRAHCYVLRGDALFQMGEKQAAIEDITHAIDIAPNDLAANRRMFAWCTGPRRYEAAQVLIAHVRDFETVLDAMMVLRGTGAVAFASARIAAGQFQGWAAWPYGGMVQVVITDERCAVSSTLKANPSHPLAGSIGNATNFALPIPPSDHAQVAMVSFEGKILLSRSTSGKRPICTPNDVSRYTKTKRSMGQAYNKFLPQMSATVIVPVYGDYAATRACIDSLTKQFADSFPFRVILVNDATPDPLIRSYLTFTAKDPRIRLLSNARNLGFVASINRALTEVSDSDVILLNADTIVPYGFIERLSAAARSSPDIGTVTPMSNNGEFTSFPIANAPNPMPSSEEIEAIDRIAAKVNADRVVDIPNGIGFCLYITRECLDAVGFLSSDYERGYLEDVDFCLRARAQGFRNVCAPSVYVGHIGSRSFGKEKRALVVHNLKIAERKFPNYRGECAAFVDLDPLRPSRQAIERANPPRNRQPYLLVTGEGSVADVVLERAQNILAEGKAALIATVRLKLTGAVTVTIVDPAANSPQSIAFNLATTDEVEALVYYLRSVMPSRIEIAGPSKIPRAFLDELIGLGIPYDILVIDGEFFGNNHTLHFGHSRASYPPLVPAPTSTESCYENHSGSDPQTGYLCQIIANADRILAPSAHAEAFLAKYFFRDHVTRLEIGGSRRRGERPTNGFSMQTPEAHRFLGIIPIRPNVYEQQLMRDFVIAFAASSSTHGTVVIGSTLDDIELLRIGNTFVTGCVDASEIGRLCHIYALSALFICHTGPLFGHPFQSSAQATGLPLAYFDWSHGGCVPRDCDLAVDPFISTPEMAEALCTWVKERGSEQY